MDFVSETQQMTIYEYHKVELDTTKIAGYSAVEFRTLPGSVNRKTSLSAPLRLMTITVHHAPPCLSAQPVFSTTAVTSASPPTKPLAAAGAMFSRGAWVIRLIQTLTQNTRSSYKCTSRVFKVFRRHGPTQARMAGLCLLRPGVTGRPE